MSDFWKFIEIGQSQFKKKLIRFLGSSDECRVTFMIYSRTCNKYLYRVE